VHFEETIKRDWKNYTSAEQKIATYFLNHLRELPFETAASIAKQVGTSPMTVGRFIRKLGYDDLRDIKDELRGASAEAAWGGELSKLTFAPASLKVNMQRLADVYKSQQSREWPKIVSMLAKASIVHVASFQAGSFLGLGFARSLHTLRPRVYFADGSDGAYVDVLLDSPPDGCLVLIDMRRYSRHFRVLAEEAAARGVRTIILTDTQCHWARELTDNVLMIETEFGVQSASMAQSLLDLLLTAVAAQLRGTETRLEEIFQLRQTFIGSAGPDGAPERAPRGRRRPRGS
jgi:DNA-binding MurR/RpiR family transcriptional regulator